jgi:hypothetical protein
MPATHDGEIIMMIYGGNGCAFASGDGYGDGVIHGNTCGGSNAFLSTPLNSWGDGWGSGYGYINVSDGRTFRKEQPAAVRLLAEGMNVLYYFSQLHTMGGWR